MLTTATRALLALADGVSLFKVDRQRFLSAVGVDSDLLEQPLKRIPTELLLDAWNIAIDWTGEPALPLKLGRYAHPADYNVLGHIMMNSANLGSAVDTAGQYQGLITNSVRGETYLEGDECIYSLSLLGNLPEHVFGRAPIERQYSNYLTICNYLTNHLYRDRIRLNRVCFTHSQAAPMADYQLAFDCPVYFDCPRNELAFDRSLLDLPVHAPDRDLLTSSLAMAEQRIQEVADCGHFSGKVRDFILKNINKGLPSAEEAARHFHVSVSTLKRRLRQENTSYHLLSEEVRRHGASHLLKNTQYPISEVAYRLGYGNNSAFYAAFRRWFAQTPHQYRDT